MMKVGTKSTATKFNVTSTEEEEEEEEEEEAVITFCRIPALYHSILTLLDNTGAQNIFPAYLGGLADLFSYLVEGYLSWS